MGVGGSSSPWLSSSTRPQIWCRTPALSAAGLSKGFLEQRFCNKKGRVAALPLVFFHNVSQPINLSGVPSEDQPGHKEVQPTPIPHNKSTKPPAPGFGSAFNLGLAEACMHQIAIRLHLGLPKPRNRDSLRDHPTPAIPSDYMMIRISHLKTLILNLLWVKPYLCFPVFFLLTRCPNSINLTRFILSYSDQNVRTSCW